MYVTLTISINWLACWVALHTHTSSRQQWHPDTRTHTLLWRRPAHPPPPVTPCISHCHCHSMSIPAGEPHNRASGERQQCHGICYCQGTIRRFALLGAGGDRGVTGLSAWLTDPICRDWFEIRKNKWNLEY